MPRKTPPADEPAAAPAVASMRPRPDAAENAQAGGRAARGTRCFNEAAARCRGKRGGAGIRIENLVMLQ